jgi:hypothetical protein
MILSLLTWVEAIRSSTYANLDWISLTRKSGMDTLGVNSISPGFLSEAPELPIRSFLLLLDMALFLKVPADFRNADQLGYRVGVDFDVELFFQAQHDIHVT